ncbi:hypothetical protein V6N11_014101 [Hibiscus sabdariffa]|uniref:Uncharacterized protein n=1 Tax=Hibiscus sabdariffa TaxID=183260 RepID=A0ABR2AFN2_9ROSI
MSAFGKAQAKGTRIGFLKWSAQSSERRSGRQVKARKHTTKAQLKVQSKQSEKSRRKQGRFPSDILKSTRLFPAEWNGPRMYEENNESSLGGTGRIDLNQSEVLGPSGIGTPV